MFENLSRSCPVENAFVEKVTRKKEEIKQSSRRIVSTGLIDWTYCKCRFFKIWVAGSVVLSQMCKSKKGRSFWAESGNVGPQLDQKSTEVCSRVCKYPEVLRKASRGSEWDSWDRKRAMTGFKFSQHLIIPSWLRALENLIEAKTSIKIEENGEYVLARNYDYAL